MKYGFGSAVSSPFAAAMESAHSSGDETGPMGDLLSGSLQLARFDTNSGTEPVVYQLMLHVPAPLTWAIVLLVVAGAGTALLLLSKRRGAANDLRLRALFDRSIDAMFLFDDSGQYVDANPAALRLLGIARDELGKHRLGDFTSAADQERVDDLRRRLSSAGSVSGEWAIRRQDGSTRWILYRSVGNILPGLHCVIAHDVTDRRNAEESLRKLSRRLMQLRDEERSRLGRELHETTAQNLAAIRLNLTRVSGSCSQLDPRVKEALQETIELTDESIAEVRTMSYLLHPPMIDQTGLLSALRWLARGFEARSGITTRVEGNDLPRLPREVETSAFRIVQEALTNVQRHSGSDVAIVRIERQDHHLRVSIEDEGRGLPANLRSNPNAIRVAGVGLAGIDERARDLGGTMTVESSDHGTRVEVIMPLSLDEQTPSAHPAGG